MLSNQSINLDKLIQVYLLKNIIGSLVKEGTGMVIDLSQNFRSRQEVLSTTNYLFKHMMDDNVGEIIYDDAAQLYYGAPYDQTDNPVQLRALIEADKETSELTGSEQEANYIVEQVKDIIANEQVFDMKTGTYRSSTFKDIVILERNTDNARNLQQAFKIVIFPSMLKSKKDILNKLKYNLFYHF